MGFLFGLVGGYLGAIAVSEFNRGDRVQGALIGIGSLIFLIIALAV